MTAVVTNSTQYAANQPGYTHGPAGSKKTVYATVAVLSTVVATDYYNMFTLPAGSRVIGGRLKCTDVDTGTAAILWDVGDSGSATRYWASSTVGQTGTTVDATMAAGGVFYKNTTKTVVIVTCHTSPATGAAGTLELAIDYILEDSATSG